MIAFSARPLRSALFASGLLLAALALPAIAGAQPAVPDPIVGTWTVTALNPDGSFFNAIQTFHADGTYTETSDLLGRLPEGPSQGAWEKVGNTYRLTFVLFGFEPDGSSYGKIRVRGELTLRPGNRRFDARYEVDILLNDGTVLDTVGTGTGLARRLTVLGLD